MIIKKGANLAGLNLVMRKVLILADKIYDQFNKELVITGGLDGTHSPGSFHYYGFALDLRIRDPETGIDFFDEATLAKVVMELKNQLGDEYFVYLEKTHIHIHYRRAYDLMGVKAVSWN